MKGIRHRDVAGAQGAATMKRTLLYTLGLMLLGASVAAAQAPPPPAPQGKGPAFVDANGDGICDNYQTRGANGQRAGKRQGPGDGSGNQGVGPRDGTGYGARAGGGTGTCTGTCTGTGQGRQYRGGRK
jgi:hypothetical protein